MENMKSPQRTKEALMLGPIGVSVSLYHKQEKIHGNAASINWPPGHVSHPSPRMCFH